MNKEYDFLFKIVLIGDSGVGKSSILIRFADDTFSESYLTTIGVDFRFRTLTVDQKNIKLQIWDTAGQERFRTITNAYYKGADAIIVVYDTTSEETFKNIDLYWMKEVRDFGEENVELLLIGNKDDDEKNKQVATDVAQKYAKENMMDFMECSAKTSDNVQTAFINIATKLYQKRIKIRQAKYGSNQKVSEKVEERKSLSQPTERKPVEEAMCCV